MVSGFDKYFIHEPRNEFELLVEQLPQEISWEKYNGAESIAEAAANYAKPGDSIVIVGSSRGCDFGQTMSLLTNKIRVLI
jgi:hypothetical protein